jgi:hypothetical protein
MSDQLTSSFFLYQFTLLRCRRSKVQIDRTVNLIQRDKGADTGEDSEQNNIQHCL